nr:hypothetical protein GCM10025699_32380 [Microbacterium flavescens]
MATAETDLRVPVELPAGRVEVSATLGRPHDAWALLGIAHGAGAGMRHPFLTGLAHALHDDGIATLRFTFPYLEAGRRMPGPAAHAVATWAGVEAAPPSGSPICRSGRRASPTAGAWRRWLRRRVGSLREG